MTIGTARRADLEFICVFGHDGFLSVTHVLLVVAIIIWEGRLRLY